MSYPRKWGTGSGETTLVDEYDWNGLLDHSLEKCASFIIRKNGSYIEAVNGSTGKIDYGGSGNAGGASGDNAAAVIQAAIDALSSGGKIFVKGIMSIDSDVTINKPSIILESDTPRHSSTVHTRIKRLIVDSVDGIVLRNFEFNELQLKANTDNINGLTVENCVFIPDGNYAHAITLTGLSSYFMQNLYFRDCKIYDWSGWIADPAAIYSNVLGGIGQVYFENLYWVAYSDNACLLKVLKGTSVWFNKGTFFVGTGQTGVKIFYLKAGGTLAELKVTEVLHEAQEDITEVTIENGTADSMTMFADINHCRFIESTGKTITLISNSADDTDWVSTYAHMVRFIDNFKPRNIGTLAVGTPNAGTRFKFESRGWKGNYVTENSGTATILSGQTSVTFAHGINAGIPNVVTLGATHAEVADAIWSADATNITITVPSAVTANRNISWSAEYKP
jgi:hypothetical protein